MEPRRYTIIYTFQLLQLCMFLPHSSSFIQTRTLPMPMYDTNENIIQQRRTALKPYQYNINNKKSHEKISLKLSSDETNTKKEVDLEKLKADLAEYLRVREEKLNNGYERKPQKGKVAGGSRGNVILDCVSASPNKATVIEEERNVFDYEELAEFGFSNLGTLWFTLRVYEEKSKTYYISQ